MNVTMQKTDAVNARLTVAVEENDYKEKVAKDLKEIRKTHAFPGFRKGQIPMSVVERRFGAQVTSDVINHEVYEAVMKFIQDNKLNVLGAPVPVDIKELDLVNQKDFTFEYDLALAPELNVEINKELHIPFYNIEVTDEMIDEQDKAFRKRFGQQGPGEEFEDDAVIKGSIMELNEDGTIKEGADAIQVIDGIISPAWFKSKEQADKFKGTKPGDKVVFNPWDTCNGDPTELSSMLHIDKARTADVRGNFEFAISEIIVVTPAELGEEFYTNVFGKDKVHNEEEYRAAIKEMIAGELASNSEFAFRFSSKNVLMDKYGNMELPAATLKKWLISRNENINEGNADEEFAKMENDLKWQLIREAIASQLGVTIEESDLLAHAKAIAARQFAQYGMTNMDDETITNYAKSILADKNYRPRLIEQVGDIKLFGAIQNAVTLDEETVSLDRFKEILSTM